MEMFEAVAPTYEQLRPMKAKRTGTFPVYPDLPDRLAAAPATPDPTVAHVLATCAGYSYSDPRWSRNLPFQHSLDDHGPQHYVAALTPPGVRSEFGD